MADQLPVKAIFSGPTTPVALGQFTPADSLAWGGGAGIDSSDDVVQRSQVFDGGGLLLTTILPPLAIGETFVVASQAAMLALAAQRGDVAIRTDTSKSYILSTDSPSTLADWKEILTSGSSAVLSVNGATGVVVLNAADVGALAVGGTAVAASTLSPGRTINGVLFDGSANITVPAGTLSPGRNINGVLFDGSADITVTAAAGTLTGTTLAATVVTSSLTSVGTLTSLATSGTAGFGGAADPQVQVYARGSTLTGASQYAMRNQVTFSSAAITAAYGVHSKITTAAAAFTVANAYGVFVADATLGAGSAITNQYGIYVDTQTQGGTNYAIRTIGTAQVVFGGTLTVTGLMGLGGVNPRSDRVLNISGTMTTGTTEIALSLASAFGSTATTIMKGINVANTTAAATYTTANVYGIFVDDWVLGSGHTVTNMHGLYIENQTVGGTNYAIRTAGTTNQVLFAGHLRNNGYVSFGGQALDSTKALLVQPTTALLTGTAQYGAYVLNAINSGATVSGTGLFARVDTQASAFTVTDTYGVYIANGTKGAGSTITTSTGLLIEDQTRGTTNWAIRTLGAAKSSFAGGITLGATGITFSDASTLTTAPGAGGDNVNIAGVFFNVDSDASDATNVDNFIWGRDRVATTGGTELMRLNAAGFLLLGTTVTTSVAAGDMVIPRGNFFRSVNNAGTDTKPLIGLDTTDTVLLGNGNVRVQSGIFLINTTVTTFAATGDIVCANQRGLRIVNSGGTGAYVAIDRTTNGTTQSTRLDPSAIGVITIGTPGYIDDATAGDLVFQNASAIRISNGAGTASAKVLTMNATNDVALNGTNSVSLQTAATDRLKIDSAGNVLLWAGAGLGGGVLVLSIHNATTDPTTNPAAGGILYASGGALKWRGSGGTVTTIAPA